MNFWRQTNHIMSFFKEENFRGEKRLPSNFITGFLEVSLTPVHLETLALTSVTLGSQLEQDAAPFCFECTYTNKRFLPKYSGSTSSVHECPLYA